MSYTVSFENLFDEIKSALSNEKKYFSRTIKDEWLNKPHHKSKQIVNSLDPFMWLTFWEGDLWLESNNWTSFFFSQSANAKKLADVSIRTPNYAIDKLRNFKANPLTCGIIGNSYIARIRDTSTFDQQLISYATWFLYNQFYSEGENGVLVPCPEENNDKFYKVSLILWLNYYIELSKNSIYADVNSFLNTLGIKRKNKNNYENVDTADGLLSFYEDSSDLPGNINYREKCDEAAKLFWSMVRTTLRELETHINSSCIFTIGGTAVNPSNYDAFAIFNSNPVYQKCRAALLQDQSLIESGNSGRVMELCSPAELLSYLDFYNSLADIEDINTFCTYLGDDFARAVNNTSVLENVYFQNRRLLSAIPRLYLRYTYAVYLAAKYTPNDEHSSKREFTQRVPLIRFSMSDEIAAHEFIKNNEAIVKIHKFGDRYGTFCVRYADESDIANIVAMQEADGEDDKNILIRSTEDSIRCAVRYNQVFVVEDFKKDFDVNDKALTFVSKGEISRKKNALAAFAVLCPHILPYSENGEENTANYNGKIIEELEKLGYNRNYYSSFNTNFVANDYRGIGLQRLFLRLLSELSAREGKSGIFCTVAPKNSVSYQNFVLAGYEKVSELDYEFDGVKFHRDFLMLSLK